MLVIYTAGELEAVTDLHTTESNPEQILIIWQPPFTLNLTDRPYSITYCIDIEDSSGKHYVSACNITETQYIFRIVSDINAPLIIIITPENSLGRGKEQNASVNNVIYNYNCQHSCHNTNNIYHGSNDTEVNILQTIGIIYIYIYVDIAFIIMALFILVVGSASVISLFITAPTLVTCIYWIIKKARSRRSEQTPDASTSTTNRNLNRNSVKHHSRSTPIYTYSGRVRDLESGIHVI
jgi:hypothetical protein